MKKNLLKATGLLLLMLLVGGSVSGQTAYTATYTFGSEGDVASFAYNGTSYDGITPGTIVKVGVTTSSSFGNFRAKPWPIGATDGNNEFTGTVDVGKYIGFTITVASGYKFTVTSITFGVGRSSTGIRQSEWRGSDDGYSSIINNYTSLNAGLTNVTGVLTNPDDNSSWTGNVLEPGASYVDILTSAGFRYYLFNAESTAGTAGLQEPITISGTFEVTIPGLWKTTATTTDWATGTNWDDGNVPASGTDVTIPTGASNYPTISADANCNNITIEDGASLKGAEYLTVNGTATMQRSISGWTNNTPGAADGWHLLSSPVGTFSINGSSFDPATNDDFYGWSENTYTWMNHKVGDPSEMVPGTGYLVSYETTTTKDFTGSFNSANIPLTNLSKTVGQGNGWHLLGNPFQSALHWTNSPSTWNPTAIGTGAKIMNSGGSYTDITSDGDYQYIPANQGFFVQATDATNSITIPLDERTHNSTAFYKSTVQNSLTLKASDGEFYVETWIQMMEGATEDFDAQFDVNFLGGMYQTPYLYSLISNDGELSTNRIAPVTQHTTVPLAFKSFLDREYTITADNASSFGNDMDVMLEDTQENVKINLKETPEYTFMATSDELSERFIVHFFNVTAIPETTQLEGLQIYSYNNRIYLHSELNTMADVTVYNMLGQEVHQTAVELSSLQSFDLNLNTGWYVVQVVTEQGVKSEKVFIN